MFNSILKKLFYTFIFTILGCGCNETHKFEGDSQIRSPLTSVPEQTENEASETALPEEPVSGDQVVDQPVNVGGSFLVECRMYESDDIGSIAGCKFFNDHSTDPVIEGLEILGAVLEADIGKTNLQLLEALPPVILRFLVPEEYFGKTGIVLSTIRETASSEAYSVSSLLDITSIAKEKIPEASVVDKAFDLSENLPIATETPITNYVMETFKLGNDGFDPKLVRCPELEAKAKENGYFGSAITIHFTAEASASVQFKLAGICDNGSANARVRTLANFKLINESSKEMIESGYLPLTGDYAFQALLGPGSYSIVFKAGVQTTGKLDDFLIDSLEIIGSVNVSGHVFSP